MSAKNAHSKDSTSETRWRRRKENRPAEILKAALECFSERGFAATKLDDIAARADVTKGTLYLYFKSKEDIFESVVRREIVGNIGDFEKIAADETLSAADLLQQLFRFVARTFALSKASALPKIIISEGGNFPEMTRFYHEEVIMRGIRLVSGIIQKGVKHGEFRKVDVENVVYCVFAPALFAIIWKHTFDSHVGKPLDVDLLFKTHFELIINGLASEKKRKS
ncbi:MAG: TetR/AcrR family transcriptional regulator [Pyrinomonadaceae bacterium]|nr:TetR/AcrR family transcriptional regulator [Pyrinomonadaceae bacterium]